MTRKTPFVLDWYQVLDVIIQSETGEYKLTCSENLCQLMKFDGQWGTIQVIPSNSAREILPFLYEKEGFIYLDVAYFESDFYQENR